MLEFSLINFNSGMGKIMALSLSKLVSGLIEHIPLPQSTQADHRSAAMLRGRGLSEAVQLTPQEAQWVHAAADFVVDQAITHPEEGKSNFLVNFDKLYKYFQGVFGQDKNYLTLHPREKIDIGVAGPGAPHADAALRRYVGRVCGEPTPEQWSNTGYAA